MELARKAVNYLNDDTILYCAKLPYIYNTSSCTVLKCYLHKWSSSATVIGDTNLRKSTFKIALHGS
jgi:hypothetical protein